MVPESSLVARFAADLDCLIPADEALGLAVSGGPDSLALLLLAAAARPGRVEAATVDHGLRAGSADEAAMVADLCARLGLPHAILTLDWPEPPTSAFQERARDKRYGALRGWLQERALAAVATGHHADDQAETLLMRLARGAGVRGLAAMRPSSPLPGDPGLRLLRPLLGWRRDELVAMCVDSGLTPAADPSNDDERFERVRVRRALAGDDSLDAEALARSAAHLAAADDALDWAAEREWRGAVEPLGEGLTYRPQDAPPEIRRRIVGRIIASLGSEGPAELRGRELDIVLRALAAEHSVTLRGVKCSGGQTWHFVPAPERSSGGR